MKKFKVNNKDLLKATEKALIGAKDTYIITVTDRKDNQGLNYASISASDGEVQALATFMVQYDFKEPMKLIIGKEFYTMVKTLSQLGKDIEIEVSDNIALIRCGTSVVPIGVKEDGMFIKPCTPKEEADVLALTFDSDAFSDAVKKGGYAFGLADARMAALKNNIGLIPYVDGDNNCLRVVTADGYVAAGASAKILRTTANFAKAVEEGRSVSVNASALSSITSRLENKITEMYIFSKQVFFKNGNDFYIIRPFELPFPTPIVNMLYQEAREYSLKLKSKEIKTVLDITMLEGNNTDISTKYVIIDMDKDGKVLVSSMTGKSSTVLNVSFHAGIVKVAFKAQFLKTAIDRTFSEEVVVSGCGSRAPIYVTGDDSKASSFILPIDIGDEKKQDEAKVTSESYEK